jgi:hypothetical protein
VWLAVRYPLHIEKSLQKDPSLAERLDIFPQILSAILSI